MYKIGEFSKLSKTTIKTLRYYEKENILLPIFVDVNGYRYYETEQLIDLAKIISLRQIGISIEEIKKVLEGKNIKEILDNREKELEKNLNEYSYQLSKIKYLKEEKKMNYEVIIKELPEYVVYYKEGKIKDFSEITNFILTSADECMKLNPNIKCIEPDYCFVNYLDGEYKEKDFTIRYSQAVTEAGKESASIKFKKLKPVNAMCIYHKGAYDGLRDAYSYIMKYIEENNYKIIESPRERYIDGIWNKEKEEEWLTEIQVPIEKNS